MTAQVSGLDITEAAKCSDFLRALPASFDNLRSEWRKQCKSAKAEEDKTFDSLSTLFNSHVLPFKRCKQQEHGSVMFAGRQGRQDDARDCWNCGAKGHFSTRCPKPKKGDGRKHRPATDRFTAKAEAKPKADAATEEVMALFGEDSLVGAVTRALDPYEEHRAVLAAMQQRYEGKIVWIIDSGATDHVCNDREAFYSIKPCETPTKYKTAGHDVVSEEAGVVAMQLRHAKKLVFADVTYLPSAPANLLSLGTLQQRGWTFDSAKGYMQLGPCRITMYNVDPKGKQQKGKLHAICLPLVMPAPKAVFPNMRSLLFVAQEKDTLLGWHRRLAHVGVSTIKEWAREGRLQITDAPGPEFKMEDCNVCAIAKAIRLTFGDVSVRWKCPLEIVHSDIAGPLKPAENNDVYYVTYINDFTGYLCAFSMPDKTAASVLSSFRIFQAMIERAFDCKIQVLRTDGGGEYKELMG
jgi:hypothetical protein